MFGVSFPELMLIGAVALIIVGPQRLPGMLGTLGKWSNKLRRMLFDVRQQSGIDDILKAEGISGGLKEIRDLRNAVRGNVSGLLTAGAAAPRQGVQQLLNQNRSANPALSAVPPVEAVADPYADVAYDRTREYPDEGCDAYGAIPDDLWAASHPEPKSAAPAVSQPPSPATAEPAGALPETGPLAVAAVAAPLVAAAIVDAASVDTVTAAPEPDATSGAAVVDEDTADKNPVGANPADENSAAPSPQQAEAPPALVSTAVDDEPAHDDSSPDSDPTAS